jgi:hypothetical protein
MTLPVSLLLRPLGELKEDEWCMAELTVNNYGEEPISFIKVEIFGDIEAEKPVQIDKLEIDELLSFQIKVRALNPDGVVVLKASKIEGGHIVDFMATTMKFSVRHEQRKMHRAYRRYAAHTEMVCKLCQEKIYPGFLVVHCGCNAVFHHKCVQDLTHCPACGRKW